MSLELETGTGTAADLTDTSAGGGDTSQAPKPVELADDALVSIKVNGQDQVVPWREARQSTMFHRDYTQKTTNLAREREEFERFKSQVEQERSQVQDRLEQIQSIFSDPNRVQQLLVALATRQQQAPTGPKPLTEEDIPKVLTQSHARMQSEMEAFKQQFATQQIASKMESDIDSFAKGLLAKYPEVSAVEGIEDTIYGRVMAMNPSSVEEAKEHIRLMIENVNRSLNTAWEEKVKRQALEKSQAVRGIEPKGGSPVWPKTPEVKRLADLDQAFIDYLQHGSQGA